MNKTRIALLGFGNVGRSLARYIAERESLTAMLDIAAVADSSGAAIVDSPSQMAALLAAKTQGRVIAQAAIGRPIPIQSDFLKAMPDLGIRVLVESLPTNIRNGQPALDMIRAALLQGSSVVTVDKGPMVRGFDELKQAGASSGARLAFTGTTGVAIPDQIGGKPVLEIRGVLNGTTNYILTQMQQSGAGFDEALSHAQRDGIAEPDPSLDVQGWDTACKILILARALMGAKAALEEVARKGIGPEIKLLIRQGKAMGRVVRLVGRARIWQGRVRVSVAPKLIDTGSPLYSVAGTSKAAVFTTADGDIVAHCKSGRDSIAETIVEDILKVIT
jgi:homoserine dehydrogenase